MRYILILAVLAATVLGCARDTGIPTLPDTPDPSGALQAYSPYDGPYRLWGEWLFYIDETHENIDVVPARNGRVHLNALKFLEEYCNDCLQITNINNNGDGTIDLTLQITHPFTGLPQFTGFDVKGIIMFEGSHVFDHTNLQYPQYPEKYRVSWRLAGDPELLNADGYTFRWSPSYESGSDMPIFKYWPGKYSSGTPTANINAYLDFYSDENRHMFECNEVVSRTFQISLPPGPVVAGYAIEACWEPPVNLPVIDPAVDFPVSANQPESYHFKMVMNDGNPVTDTDCCNELPPPFSVHELRAEINIWYEAIHPDVWEGYYKVTWFSNTLDWSPKIQICFPDDNCDGPPGWYCLRGEKFIYNPVGLHKCIAFEHHIDLDFPEEARHAAFDLFEIVIEY